MTVLGAAACGDNHTGEQLDAGVDPGADAQQPDAPVDLVRRISVNLEDVRAVMPADAPSTLGFTSAETPYGTGASSWRYKKPSTGAVAEKFELYVPLGDTGASVPAAFEEMRTYLGPITIANVASIKLHTRRNDATTPDFTMIAYTVPHTAGENDASWYARRLHALPEWVRSPAAPAATWNARSTSDGANQIRFWDFRNANIAAGLQPSDNYFTLAEMQAGPLTPTGATTARDYRAEQLLYLSFSTLSDFTQVDASIDGIEILLTNGKGVMLDLAGDATTRHATVSLAQLRASHSAGNSYGVATTASAVGPYGNRGTSWNVVKNATSPSNEKFEVHLPFAAPAVAPLWSGIRSHLGEFTIADIASLTVRSRKPAAATTDFVVILYTTPDGTDDDASWFGRRLHAQLDWAGSLAAPADTWNTFSTAAGTNQIKFWDFRPGWIVPTANFSTLAEIQAGPVTPTGTTLPARDYRTETVQYITLSTYSEFVSFDASIDGIEIQLKNGKSLVLDLDR